MYLFDNKDTLIYHCGGGLYLKADEKEYFVVFHVAEQFEKDAITEWLDGNFDSDDIVHIKHGIWLIWGFSKIEDVMAFKLRWF